jgi:peroxiredoxin
MTYELTSTISSEAVQLVPGDVAPDTPVFDLAGDRLELRQAWAGGPVLLTFLRHFGCIFCREWLVQLEAHAPQLQAAGLRIVAVGIGEARHARRYGPRLAPSVTTYTTPDASAHAAFGLAPAGVAQFANPRVAAAGLRAVLRGQLQGQATGETRILGATFVVNRGGLIRFAHYDAFAGDHADLSAALRAAQRT